MPLRKYVVSQDKKVNYGIVIKKVIVMFLVLVAFVKRNKKQKNMLKCIMGWKIMLGKLRIKD